MKQFYLLLLITSLCFGQNDAAAKKAEAKRYYESARGILSATVHNAISQDMAAEALDYSNKAIALDPTVSEHFRVRGTSYFILKDFKPALESHDAAIKIDSANSLAWMGKGIVYENSNEFEKAEENYKKAIDLNDDNLIVICFNIAHLYNHWNKSDMAIAYYSLAIEHDSDYRSAYTNRGEAKLRLKLYNEAISDFNMAILLDATDKVSYNNRGLCRYYIKEYITAISDFDKALSIHLGTAFDENFDTDKYSYNNMANCFFALGNFPKACKFWNIAIEKGYEYKPEWKAIYNIDDPKELIRINCK